MEENFFPADMWSECLEKALAGGKPPVVADDPPILHNAADLEWLQRTVREWQEGLAKR